jgi:hypothetical protein
MQLLNKQAMSDRRRKTIVIDGKMQLNIKQGDDNEESFEKKLIE